MAALPIFGVVTGILFGIGGQIIQAVRDRQDRAAKSSSGRGKRAMVGAVVLGLLGIAMLSFARIVIGPPPPGGMTFGEAVVLILILSVIGAVLGLLSDRF